MATLADAFLQDYEAEAEDNAEDNHVKQEALEPLAELKEIDDMDETSTSGPGVEQVGELLADAKFNAHMKRIGELENLIIDATDKEAVNEQARDIYALIIQSNEYSAAIDNEIASIHKYLRDMYATKLKDLEQVVQTPLEYAKVVKIIGNETDLTRVDLTNVLPPDTILTITVTASTSTGKPLQPEDLQKVMAACDHIIQLDDHKRRIFTFVEARMGLIAPNLSAICGPSIAAQLMGLAGGLLPLSKMPSCNVQVLGVKKRTMAGFSNASLQRHMGLLISTDVILATPNDLKQRALRLIASKVTLAARVDAFQEDPTGSTGQELRETIEKKIEKWQEPPPQKKKKALPAPDDKPRKRRGGKRFRKQREKFKVTELQKQKNRMAFGAAEATDEYTGEGFGMLGQEGSGKLKVTAKTKQKLAAKGKKQLTKLRRPKAPGGLTTNIGGAGGSGLASTIAFTPVQGMELVNPDSQKQRQAEAANKYFSSTAGFSNLKKTLPPVPAFNS